MLSEVGRDGLAVLDVVEEPLDDFLEAIEVAAEGWFLALVGY